MLEIRKGLVELFNINEAYREDIAEAFDHGIIVSNLAYLLAKELGLSEEECRNIADAGLLHDIGKLKLGVYLYGRSENVLRVEEMKYVRMHPTIGYDLLKEKEVLSDEDLLAIYHHHENYDGSGYPDNLAGEDIPYKARILRTCDVFAALVSERPYRDAFEQSVAIELMVDEVKNFDMHIFLSFLKLVHSDEFSEIKEYIDYVNRKAHVKQKDTLSKHEGVRSYGRINARVAQNR